MISKVAFLKILLLASTSALADHTSQPEAALARRDGACTIDSDEIQWNSYSSGSLLGGGDFNLIKATVTIPTLTGSDGAVLIRVDFDPSCFTGAVGVNIQGSIVDGKTSWSAWCQWPPLPREYVKIAMQAGDTITVTIIVFSEKTAAVIWRNQRGATFTHDFNATNPLCMIWLGWGVEAVTDQNGTILPLASFSPVTFTNAMATATGSHETYFPCGPTWYTIYGIEQNSRYITEITGNGSTFTIEHI